MRQKQVSRTTGRLLKRIDHLLQLGILLAIGPAKIVEYLQLLDRLVELVGLQIKLTEIFIGAPVIGFRLQCPFVESQSIEVMPAIVNASIKIKVPRMFVAPFLCLSLVKRARL
jgi:hypothetical protein